MKYSHSVIIEPVVTVPDPIAITAGFTWNLLHLIHSLLVDLMPRSDRPGNQSCLSRHSYSLRQRLESPGRSAGAIDLYQHRHSSNSTTLLVACKCRSALRSEIHMHSRPRTEPTASGRRSRSPWIRHFVSTIYHLSHAITDLGHVGESFVMHAMSLLWCR